MPAFIDKYLELEYGKLYQLDLHGLTLEEAKSNIINLLNHIDSNYNGILIIHGYHKGRVLKDYFRKIFNHNLIYKKINLDASRTIYLLSFN